MPTLVRRVLETNQCQHAASEPLIYLAAAVTRG